MSDYSILPYMRRRWNVVGRKLAFNATTEMQWRTWRRKTCTKLRELIGYDTFRRAPLKPRLTEERDCGDYIRQRVEIQTEPGIVMPMFVLVPRNTHPPYRVVLAPHGHCGGGKVAVAGIRDNPDVSKAIDQYNYDYGVQLARTGFIVFCPDARGHGERREAAESGDIMKWSCQWLNQMALPLGQTVTGMWTWDLHRLIDYVETRADCDASRLGCAGLSGGGLQTLWATALDDRIKCAVVSGYFYGHKESLLDQHTNCSCNFVPHLWEHADMGDITALIAPRPLLVETGTKDALNGASGLKNVYSQMHITARAYRLLDTRKNLKHDVFEGGHRWHGVEAIPWLQQHLV
jgi:dienelactone hydrolase